MKPSFYLKISSFFVFLLVTDQLSKYSIRHSGGFYICNKNIAWGINIPDGPFWIIWIALIIVLVSILLATNQKIKDTRQKDDKSSKAHIYNSLFIILIVTGAISNIIDRLLFGCVIDIINLGFWPVFNLADSFIVWGGILLLAKYLKS